MNLYIFTCSPSFGDPLSVLKNIDSVRDIRTPFENLYFIKSSDTATALTKKIIEVNPGKRFIISEVSNNRQGWLPKDIWDFIRDN